MEMPKPNTAHAKLEALAGEWEGTETMHPSPWRPEGGTAVGHFQARLGLDGFHLITDYQQLVDGKVTFTGHGVYGWDGKRERYTMYWFDSMGSDPGGAVLGNWEGDTLRFQGTSDMGHHRYTYWIGAPDHYRFRIENSRDGATWTRMMDGEYRRVRR